MLQIYPIICGLKAKIHFLFHLFNNHELNTDNVAGRGCDRLWRCKDVTTTFTTSSNAITNEDIAVVAVAAANKMIISITNIY